MLEKLARAIAKTDMPFNQKVACLGQAGIESGVFRENISKLAKEHLNFWGLKWRNEMAGFAQPVLYKAHDGEEHYCKFESFDAAARGYQHFIKRSPYSGYEKYLFRVDSYLTFIGPIFCPPGFKESWAEKHDNLFYDEYVMMEFCGDAYDLIEKYQDETPTPTPEPEPGVKKLKILLDPGHSQSDPGAVSPNKKVREYALNVEQARHIKAELTEHQVDIYDPNPDNLIGIGAKAAGYDIFISLHHNSYGGTREPGVEAFTIRNNRETETKLAEMITQRIAIALNIPNRGHKKKNYTVIDSASNFCKCCVLVESHFITDEFSMPIALAKSLKASNEIIRSIRDVAHRFASTEEQSETFPSWIGIREFKKSENVRLTKNFYSSEFNCKCNRCSITKIDYLQLKRLQELRDYYRKPLIIHSAYRCPHHNAAVGGVSNSQHLTGRATDFHIQDMPISKLYSAVHRLWENGGIGQYSTFWHTDTWSKRRW